jgi:hypothetical protein
VAEWWALTPAQRLAYTPRNRVKGLSGQQLFLRKYLKSY